MRAGPENLLRAMGAVRRQATDPRLEALQALAGVGHGSDVQSAAPAAGASAGLVPLQAAYQAYLQRSGQEQDPLAAQVGQPGPHTGLGAPSPIELLRYGGQPLRQITHGANAGQYAQTYKLGGGRFANVYYDRGGKRRVRVYTA